MVHAALPCYVWTERTREVVDENRTAGIVDFRLICAKQTDLQSDDRVTLTTENEELRVMGSPVVRLDHLDAALERVT